MTWFRFYNEFASDPKVQSMPEVMQRRLVMLFCYQSSGTLTTYDDETLAFALHLSPEELEATKQLFVKKGFIKSNWSIKNWEKRQYRSDSSADRVKRYRDASKQAAKPDEMEVKRECNGDVTVLKRPGNGDVTPSHVRAHAGADSDTDTESEKRDEEERTHANPKREVIPFADSPPKGEIKACPDLAWVDRLSEQIEDWFPGTGLAARVYDIATSGGFRPEAVEYGFDEGYRMKCRGELMDELRIVGLIRYAQERGLSVAMRLDKNGNPGESVTHPNVPFSQRKQLDFHVSRRRLAEMEAAKTREAV